MKMTYNEALKIQHAQMIYYRQLIGRVGVNSIRKRTKPCPKDPNEPMYIYDINALIPRGGSFEQYIKAYPKDRDQTAVAWHNAIRNNKVYH